MDQVSRLQDICQDLGGRFEDSHTNAEIDEGIGVCDVGGDEIVVHDHDGVDEMLLRRDQGDEIAINPTSLYREWEDKYRAEDVSGYVKSGPYGRNHIRNATAIVTPRGISYEENRRY